MELVQLVYHSSPAAELAGTARLAAFRSIHKTAVARNKVDGVGGFLVLTRTHFIQLLEGERGMVLATYDRIRRDSRHTNCTLVDIAPCRIRQFEAWAMGTVQDAFQVREAMLECGIGADVDMTGLNGRQIAAILLNIAQKTRPLAA